MCACSTVPAPAGANTGFGMAISWPERAGVGVFILAQPMALMLSAPHYDFETVKFWEISALVIALIGWGILRTLKFVFSGR